MKRVGHIPNRANSQRAERVLTQGGNTSNYSDGSGKRAESEADGV